MSDNTESKLTKKESGESIKVVIESREQDLGGFSVRRLLPFRKHRMVGPFVFFDHMGPAKFSPGEGIQVRPHPHIGLATVTYLFEGEITHRDSLGYVQTIKPKTINLMTAGRGIVHSERIDKSQDQASSMHGIQAWIALPSDQEECEPAFKHHPSDDIPLLDKNGVSVRVLMGDAYGYQSSVKVFSPTLYLECDFPKGAELTLPKEYQELAVYVVSGEIKIESSTYAEGTMVVAIPGKVLNLTALEESRVMVIGGDAIGERFILWNFVSSSKERLEKAKADWKAQRFDAISGETEFTEFPE